MSIPFTQYMLPNGRKRTVLIDRSEEIEKKAYSVIDHGWVFEVEVLSTGEVSLTVDSGEQDEVIIICDDNEESIAKSVDGLIEQSYRLVKED